MPIRDSYAKIAREDLHLLEMFLWKEREKRGEIISDTITINSISGDKIISLQ
jgi:hypothetical protein